MSADRKRLIQNMMQNNMLSVYSRIWTIKFRVELWTVLSVDITSHVFHYNTQGCLHGCRYQTQQQYQLNIQNQAPIKISNIYIFYNTCRIQYLRWANAHVHVTYVLLQSSLRSDHLLWAHWKSALRGCDITDSLEPIPVQYSAKTSVWDFTEEQQTWRRRGSHFKDVYVVIILLIYRNNVRHTGESLMCV